jgi:hypothetical protein
MKIISYSGVPMKRIVPAGLLLIVCGVCLNLLPQLGTAQTAQSESGKIKPVDVSMHDFMEGMFQAPYRRLKPAIAAAPADNADWKMLRSDALILAEGCNLLLTRLPEKNSEDWIKHSEVSRDAGETLVKAAKKKDFAAARAAYEKMLTNCNACHKQFEEGKHILEP